MGKIVFYVFVLAMLLIAVAYYAGLTSDANAIGSNANTILKTVTGRTQTGAFGAYPAKG